MAVAAGDYRLSGGGREVEYLPVFAPGAQSVHFESMDAETVAADELRGLRAMKALPDSFLVPKRMIEDYQRICEGGKYAQDLTQIFQAGSCRIDCHWREEEPR